MVDIVTDWLIELGYKIEVHHSFKLYVLVVTKNMRTVVINMWLDGKINISYPSEQSIDIAKPNGLDELRNAIASILN